MQTFKIAQKDCTTWCKKKQKKKSRSKTIFKLKPRLGLTSLFPHWELQWIKTSSPQPHVFSYGAGLIWQERNGRHELSHCVCVSAGETRTACLISTNFPFIHEILINEQTKRSKNLFWLFYCVPPFTSPHFRHLNVLQCEAWKIRLWCANRLDIRGFCASGIHVWKRSSLKEWLVWNKHFINEIDQSGHVWFRKSVFLLVKSIRNSNFLNAWVKKKEHRERKSEVLPYLWQRNAKVIII